MQIQTWRGWALICSYQTLGFKGGQAWGMMKCVGAGGREGGDQFLKLCKPAECAFMCGPIPWVPVWSFGIVMTTLLSNTQASQVGVVPWNIANDRWGFVMKDSIVGKLDFKLKTIRIMEELSVGLNLKTAAGCCTRAIKDRHWHCYIRWSGRFLHDTPQAMR